MKPEITATATADGWRGRADDAAGSQARAAPSAASPNPSPPASVAPRRSRHDDDTDRRRTPTRTTGGIAPAGAAAVRAPRAPRPAVAALRRPARQACRRRGAAGIGRPAWSASPPRRLGAAAAAQPSRLGCRDAHLHRARGMTHARRPGHAVGARRRCRSFRRRRRRPALAVDVHRDRRSPIDWRRPRAAGSTTAFTYDVYAADTAAAPPPASPGLAAMPVR